MKKIKITIIFIAFYIATFPVGFLVVHGALGKWQMNRASKASQKYLEILNSNSDLFDLLNQEYGSQWVIQYSVDRYKIIYSYSYDCFSISTIKNGEQKSKVLFYKGDMELKYVYGVGFYHPVAFSYVGSRGRNDRLATNMLMGQKIESSELNELLSITNYMIAQNAPHVIRLNEIAFDLNEALKLQPKE